MDSVLQEGNAQLLLNRPVKTEPTDDAAESNLMRTVVYTTKLEDMQIFKRDINHITMKYLLDNILIESLPKLKNLSPYICPSLDIQKRKCNEMAKKIEFIKQNSLFLHDLDCTPPSDVYRESESVADYKPYENPDPLINSFKEGDLSNIKIISVKSEVEDSAPVSKISDVVDATVITALSKTDNINMTSSKTKVFLKFKELLKLCKPVRVVLTDFRKNLDISSSEDDLPLQKLKRKDKPRKSAMNKHGNADCRNILQTSTVTGSGKLQYLNAFQRFIDVFNVNKNIFTSDNSCNIEKQNQKTMTSTMFVIVNLYSNDVDMYWVDEKGCLVDYYKTNENHITKITIQHPQITDTFKKQMCCWYQRENYIETLDAKYINVATRRFMRKPHKCFPEGCVCCCKKSIEKSNSLTVANISSHTEDKKIKKMANDTSVIIKRSNSIPPNTVFMIDNLYCNEVDIYCVNKRGCLAVYYKTNKENVPEILIQYPEIVNTFRTEVCCWCQRDKYIENLEAKFINIATRRIMRKPHKCLSEVCMCCCKKRDFINVEESNSLTLVNVPPFSENKDINKLDSEISKNIEKRHQKSTANTVIMIENLFCNNFDIYYVNKCGGLVICFKTNKQNVTGFSIVYPEPTHTIKKEICCWYQRVKYIESLEAKFINGATRRFMRKPHDCFPRNCRCCCKKGDINGGKNLEPSHTETISSILRHEKIEKLENRIPDTAVNTKEKSTDFNILKGLLMKNWTPPNSLIATAMLIETRLAQASNPFCSENTLITLKNVLKNQMENYELGPKGQVTAYFKWFICSRNNLMYSKLTGLKSPKILGNVCCSVSREYLVSKLTARLMPTNAIKFIRNLHTCPDSKCSCCCSKILQQNTPYKHKKVRTLVDINWPMRAAHSKLNVKPNFNKHVETAKIYPKFNKNRQIVSPNNKFKCKKSALNLDEAKIHSTISNLKPGEENHNFNKAYHIDNFIKKELMKRYSEKNTPKVLAGDHSNATANLFQGKYCTSDRGVIPKVTIKTPCIASSFLEFKSSDRDNNSHVQHEVISSGTLPEKKIVDTLTTTNYIQTSTKANILTTPVKLSSDIEINSHHKLIANDFSELTRATAPTTTSTNASKLTPKPNKVLVGSFANYLFMKKKHSRDSFLSYFVNLEVNEPPTPVIENVFSLCPDVISKTTNSASATITHKQANNIKPMNDSRMNNDYNEIGDSWSQTNKIKTNERKRKAPEEQVTIQKINKYEPTSSASENIDVATFQSLETEMLPNISDKINQTGVLLDSNALPAIIGQTKLLSPIIVPETYQQSQGNSALLSLLSATSQNKFETLDSQITSPSNAGQFSSQMSVMSKDGNQLLVISPIALPSPLVTPVTFEPFVSATNDIGIQQTSKTALNSLVKIEADTHNDATEKLDANIIVKQEM